MPLRARAQNFMSLSDKGLVPCVGKKQGSLKGTVRFHDVRPTSRARVGPR
jgi:hypothetical protein